MFLSKLHWFILGLLAAPSPSSQLLRLRLGVDKDHADAGSTGSLARNRTYPFSSRAAVLAAWQRSLVARYARLELARMDQAVVCVCPV